MSQHTIIADPTTVQQLYGMYQNVSEIEHQISQLQQERDAIRAQISELVEDNGGKIAIDGVAKFEMLRPTVIASYDRSGIEALVRQLATTGQSEIAERIEQHRKERMRSGSLRITKPKQTTEG
jgi:ABC-type Fe2+-enterobactin transport system substrate-binding protein